MLRTCKVNLSDNLAKYISVLFISEYGILVNILSACRRVHPGIYESWVSVSVIFVCFVFISFRHTLQKMFLLEARFTSETS